MTEDQKQPDDKFESAREPGPAEDVVAPTSDEALNERAGGHVPRERPDQFRRQQRRAFARERREGAARHAAGRHAPSGGNQ